MRSKRKVNEIDMEIGTRIRAFREMNKMTQSAVAKHLDVTFQQLQKYENGSNRVSISAFINICKALSIDPMDLIGSYFSGSGETPTSALATELSILRAKLSHIRTVAA